MEFLSRHSIQIGSIAQPHLIEEDGFKIAGEKVYRKYRTDRVALMVSQQQQYNIIKQRELALPTTHHHQCFGKLSSMHNFRLQKTYHLMEDEVTSISDPSNREREAPDLGRDSRSTPRNKTASKDVSTLIHGSTYRREIISLKVLRNFTQAYQPILVP